MSPSPIRPLPRILLAEDDHAFRLVCTHKLRHEGYIVVAVENGDDALKILKEQKPDLLLLDLILPKKTGFSVLEERAKSKDLLAIPVIVLSVLAQESDREQAIELGATDYFSKEDMSFPQLLTKVNTLLRHHPTKQKEDLSKYIPLFMADALKILKNVEKHLQTLKSDPYNQEAIDETWRMFHSLHGTASMLKLKALADLCLAPELLFREIHDEGRHVSGTIIHETEHVMEHIQTSLKEVAKRFDSKKRTWKKP